MEYNVYGMESSPELSYQFNKTTRAWEKRYKIYDYIGNLRILANSSGTVLEKHSYTPYGEELKTSADLSKTTWLGKERDAESGLGDHGVRKYDWETGRFTGTDPLWEKYYGWNPWQYSANNPVMLVDVNGKWITKKSFVYLKEYIGVVGIVLNDVAQYSPTGKKYIENIESYNRYISFEAVGLVGAAGLASLSQSNGYKYAHIKLDFDNIETKKQNDGTTFLQATTETVMEEIFHINQYKRAEDISDKTLQEYLNHQLNLEGKKNREKDFEIEADTAVSIIIEEMKANGYDFSPNKDNKKK